MSIKTVAQAFAFRAKIEKAANNLTDNDALNSVELFEKWNGEKDYKTGDRVVENGILYKATQDIVKNPTWQPSLTPALWKPLADEAEEGTLENPITAVVGMDYIGGLYYKQDSEIYLCTREGVNTLYYLPSELIGIYFEKATGAK